MHDFNIYSNTNEANAFRKLAVQHGERIVVKKNDYLVRKDQESNYLSYIRQGGVKCIGTNEAGDKRRILGFIFEEELIANYLPARIGQPALLDMQAIEDTVVYRINMDEYPEFFEKRIGGRHYVSRLVEEIAYQHLLRCVSLACKSTTERYNELIHRVPNIFERVYARDIASYLGITPETLSRMRTSLLLGKHKGQRASVRCTAKPKESDKIIPAALMPVSC